MKPVFTNTIFAIIIIFTFSSCGNNNSDTDPNLPSVSIGIPPPQKLNFTIIGQRNHDTSAYTQGLIYYKGVMYEGTGDYENSSLRITDWKTGNVLNKHMMGSSEIFGEGITILNDTLFQLTWTNNIVYVYLLDNLDKPIKTFKWPYEGWGITTDGMNLLISDGSSNIYTVRPSDFKILNTIQIIDNDGPVNYLNELELINGGVNIKETADNFVVEVAAPGMTKKDFKIELDGNMLTISSEKSDQREENEDEKYTRKEFSYQSFYRTFNLPKEVVDAEKIEAKYENGLLHLMIPKKEEAKQKPPRLIQIS